MNLLNILFWVGWNLKNADIICYALTSLVSMQQRNVKKSQKSLKIVNIEGENVHVFWTTSGIAMKFSGNTWLRIILKVKSKQDFSLSLSLSLSLSRKHIFGKNQRGWCVKLTVPNLFRVNIRQSLQIKLL